MRVVVVNFNGGDLVVDCVRSVLAEAGSPGLGSLQVVVVDNGSGDGSADRLAATFGDAIVVVRNATNEGFVAANVGMAPLAGLDDPDYVALLNPDATLEPGCLAELVGALAADPAAGAASPCMLFAHRFVDVEVQAPPEPSGSDPRALALQLWEVATAGRDRLGQVWAGPGVGDPEEHGGRRFRWLGPTATLGVPVPLRAGGCEVSLVLTSPSAKSATVSGPLGPVSVPVGPEPTTVTVPLTVSLADADATVATDADTAVASASATASATADGEAVAVDRIANAGSQVFDDGAGADRGHFALLGPPYDAPGEVFAWCGGGVLLRWEFLRDVGRFEPSLFLYYEDTDLSWRGRARGWHYRYVPTARVRHVQGASGGAGSDRFVVSTTRNRLVVAVRNAPWVVVRRAVAATWRELWSSVRHEVLVPLTRLRHPVTRMARLRLRGIAAATAALPAALAARRRLQRLATVDPAVVAAGLVPRGGGAHH